jgi:hypothetical protein
LDDGTSGIRKLGVFNSLPIVEPKKNRQGIVQRNNKEEMSSRLYLEYWTFREAFKSLFKLLIYEIASKHY